MRLSIYQNGRFLRALSLSKDTLRIGRLPSCDLVLEGNGVARYHALLERSTIDGSWTVLTMGGAGTLLNGQAVTALARAKIGDELTIGSYKVLFIDETSTPRKEPLQADPDMVIVPLEGELIAAPVAPVLWAATAEEMSAEPTTGEVQAAPLDFIDEDEPVFLLTQRKRSTR
jgi:pSer/pThr/pTyr-binding forkhead associated (FHA) protein